MLQGRTSARVRVISAAEGHFWTNCATAGNYDDSKCWVQRFVSKSDCIPSPRSQVWVDKTAVWRLVSDTSVSQLYFSDLVYCISVVYLKRWTGFLKPWQCKLEGTHRVPSCADDWLHHLANVNESRFLYAKSTYWPCDLDLWPFNLKSIPLREYPKVIPYTEFEHFGIIRFWVILQTNRQTNRWHRTLYPCQPTG